MAIEKLKLDEIVTNTFPHHATRKINEIIDHINSQATTPATKVDLAGVELITNNRKVEQEPNKVELVPLDVEEILDCMTNAHLTKDAVRAILSKYWVPKQEEKVDNLVLKHTFNNATPTPQATSVIDVEEVVEKIDKIVLNYCTLVDWEKAGLFSKEDIKSILSSLPIQKKRTIEEVEKYRNLDYLENEVKYTIQFLQDNWLLAD